MRRQGCFRQGLRGWLRLHEKGGKRHDVPAHHRAEEALEPLEGDRAGQCSIRINSQWRICFRWASDGCRLVESAGGPLAPARQTTLRPSHARPLAGSRPCDTLQSAYDLLHIALCPTQIHPDERQAMLT